VTLFFSPNTTYNKHRAPEAEESKEERQRRKAKENELVRRREREAM